MNYIDSLTVNNYFRKVTINKVWNYITGVCYVWTYMCNDFKESFKSWLFIARVLEIEFMCQSSNQLLIFPETFHKFTL